MAERPVYVTTTKAPYVTVYKPEFTWNAGLNAVQKQKNIVALHDAFKRMSPESKVLEISSKSLQPLGIKLSAFNLPKYVPSLGKSVPLECVYHGGKIFAAGGPYTDLYTATARAAKKDERLKSSGELRGFAFEGEQMPLIPRTAFYDWLYVNALMENPELAEQVMEFDAFTDIEFNPNKSLNCQARAAALFVAMKKLGRLEECRKFQSFLTAIR